MPSASADPPSRTSRLQITLKHPTQKPAHVCPAAHNHKDPYSAVESEDDDNQPRGGANGLDMVAHMNENGKQNSWTLQELEHGKIISNSGVDRFYCGAIAGQELFMNSIQIAESRGSRSQPVCVETTLHRTGKRSLGLEPSKTEYYLLSLLTDDVTPTLRDLERLKPPEHPDSHSKEYTAVYSALLDSICRSFSNDQLRPMNRKKTGTGPDRNRLQPDLRLRFIRPENFTGCGSSQFGKWVNRYRAGWDRHDQPRPSDNANFDNADQMGTTTTLPTPGPTAATPTSIPRTGLNNDNLKTTTRHHQRTTNDHDHQHRVDNHDHNCTNNLANNTRKDDTSTTATPRQRQHQQIDNNDDRPQQQHVDNNDDDTSTAATTTRQQPQHQHDNSRQPQHHHINNHNDGRNNNASTTTVHDDDTRQLRLRSFTQQYGLSLGSKLRKTSYAEAIVEKAWQWPSLRELKRARSGRTEVTSLALALSPSELFILLGKNGSDLFQLSREYNVHASVKRNPLSLYLEGSHDSVKGAEEYIDRVRKRTLEDTFDTPSKNPVPQEAFHSISRLSELFWRKPKTRKALRASLTTDTLQGQGVAHPNSGASGIFSVPIFRSSFVTMTRSSTFLRWRRVGDWLGDTRSQSLDISGLAQSRGGLFSIDGIPPGLRPISNIGFWVTLLPVPFFPVSRVDEQGSLKSPHTGGLTYTDTRFLPLELVKALPSQQRVLHRLVYRRFPVFEQDSRHSATTKFIRIEVPLIDHKHVQHPVGLSDRSVFTNAMFWSGTSANVDLLMPDRYMDLRFNVSDMSPLPSTQQPGELMNYLDGLQKSLTCSNPDVTQPVPPLVVSHDDHEYILATNASVRQSAVIVFGPLEADPFFVRTESENAWFCLIASRPNDRTRDSGHRPPPRKRAHFPTKLRHLLHADLALCRQSWNAQKGQTSDISHGRAVGQPKSEDRKSAEDSPKGRPASANYLAFSYCLGTT
ncbi:hypothetical protein EDB85DRAFT_1894624 [Lactarius pseudohatsudake]|nr:hypothetical protein EDB85DRAFT_1894624 [Lactarius pseudohatsudake]